MSALARQRAANPVEKEILGSALHVTWNVFKLKVGRERG